METDPDEDCLALHRPTILKGFTKRKKVTFAELLKNKCVTRSSRVMLGLGLIPKEKRETFMTKTADRVFKRNAPRAIEAARSSIARIKRGGEMLWAAWDMTIIASDAAEEEAAAWAEEAADAARSEREEEQDRQIADLIELEAKHD